MLCFRCEHRVEFLVTGHGPRCECQQPTLSSSGCYMYIPTKPALLKKVKGDKRPQFGPWIFSARSRYAGIDEKLTLNAKLKDGIVALYWGYEKEKKCSTFGTTVRRKVTPRLNKPKKKL